MILFSQKEKKKKRKKEKKKGVCYIILQPTFILFELIKYYLFYFFKLLFDSYVKSYKIPGLIKIC